MNPHTPTEQPMVKALVHDPDADLEQHQEEHHDPAEEVAHAKRHAVENIYFFIGFFSLICVAVAVYEFNGTRSLAAILVLAALRSLLIAGFFVWLIGSFSFVVRTIVFTVLFLIGMIALSIWAMGDPISLLY